MAQTKWKDATNKVKESETLLITDNRRLKVSQGILNGSDVKEREARLNAWWIDALNFVQAHGEEDQLIAKIRNDLLEREERERGKNRVTATHISSLANRFHSTATLKHIIFAEMSNLRKKRDVVLNALLMLGERTPTAADVELSGNCKQCRQYLNKTGQVCDHCKVHVLLMNYDSCLYRYRKKATKQRDELQGKMAKNNLPPASDDDTFGFGSFRESSESEQILAHIARYLKSMRPHNDQDTEKQLLAQAGGEHIKIFQAMKHELKLAHEVPWPREKENAVCPLPYNLFPS